jgi:hypothetical protein
MADENDVANNKSIANIIMGNNNSYSKNSSIASPSSSPTAISHIEIVDAKTQDRM